MVVYNKIIVYMDDDEQKAHFGYKYDFHECTKDTLYAHVLGLDEDALDTKFSKEFRKKPFIYEDEKSKSKVDKKVKK